MNYFKLFGAFVIGSLLITSCSSDTFEEEEKEQEVTYQMEVTLGTRSLSTDAFAVYCNTNGKEELRVSNNQALLDGEWTEDLTDGDFVFVQVNDGTSEYALGGGFYSADLSGLANSILSITPDITFEVESNNGTTVDGSLSGNIFLIDIDGNTAFLPLSVDYTAEITGTSTFCN